MRSSRDLDLLIRQWFDEDVGSGDHTSFGTIPEAATGRAQLLVKEEGVLAGMDMAPRIFHHFDPLLKIEVYLEDGSEVSVGQKAFRVSGSARSILQCERLVLNVMQRMSGIATTTRHYVKLLEGTSTRILDTRKTSPGLRLLEKQAVRIGGGMNHRFGLDDMIMIKDNHVDFAGGIVEAIKSVQGYQQRKGLELDIVVETRSLADVQRVLDLVDAGPDRKRQLRRIMLDNFSQDDTRKAVDMISGKLETESSGGITDANIRSYAECGVDYISVGALTHQIKSLDLSLKAEF